MFRLLKLAAYALLGYVVYEMIMGFKEGDRPMFQQGSASRHGATRRQPKGGKNISGSGRGESVSVEDAGGAKRTERVGRGATS